MDKIDEILTRGVESILPSKKGLHDLLRSKKITLFQGFDPTAPSLHIGHFIGLRKMSQLQKLGHKVIFLIGDFTGLIGDPTDKEAARKKQTREEVLENLKSYKKQASKILDFEGENKAQIVFNNDWLSKLTFKEVIDLASNFTVQQMIERDMFQKRIKEEKPIYLHEFLYPLMQGYDSLAMVPGGVDLEVGGNDQLFNMMAGRTLMKSLKNKEKYVLSMKLLTDSHGKKMGKSEGNAIFLTDTAKDMFGKIMSWPDSFIKPSLELLTDLPLTTPASDPMSTKKMLALEIVKQIHGESEAVKAQATFERSFSEKAPEFDLTIKAGNTLTVAISELAIGESVSEAKRLIKQGAVDVNGKRITDSRYVLKKGDKLKVGKKTFAKVV